MQLELVAVDHVSCNQVAEYFSDGTMAIFTAKELAAFSLNRLEAECTAN
ncbi:hypothetical protein ACPOL_4753 [Acidisarcina polymorpha]|uniref:Uncharacterized protein n=1 Tax=Acidisarcina polymorpha TaxID=2211140 RepID=A0A2Z5G4M0_9BACT|nr:hypothetical protein [Acidisarcina polymorpha]AXC14021.1 hypothetical protein ACPOL_4753 [Acidisarcina polymorpha]